MDNERRDEYLLYLITVWPKMVKALKEAVDQDIALGLVTSSDQPMLACFERIEVHESGN